MTAMTKSRGASVMIIFLADTTMETIQSVEEVAMIRYGSEAVLM